MGAHFFFWAVANPIYVSNSNTKFGKISFNGKGEDSIRDCDDARKYLEIFFFRKVLLAYRSLQNVFAGLIKCLIFIYTTLTNFSTNYLVMCKVYTVGGIK